MKMINIVIISTCLLMTPLQSAKAAIPDFFPDGKAFPSLSPMLKQVNPAVVNISTYSTQQYRSNPLMDDPFFRRFFRLPDENQLQRKVPRKRQQSAGSGVVIDAGDGYVMTNYHVIKDADEVRVSLVDGRAFAAEILGSDPALDIAILKIKADGLTEVPLADSGEIEVGDFVVAIGNPFGLGQTVTTGIVSALGRSGLGLEGYENFIQTDASINPGNSGGALVNLSGELVGINTAIIAPAGGNVGIGFAIPVNMARASMEQIIDHGEVKRGQIGIGIQDISSELREAFNLENGQHGVLVSNVQEDSPAEKAGLRSGDIVLQVDGRDTRSTGQLRSQIGMKRIGDKVKLTLWRDGKKKSVSLAIGNPLDIAAVDGPVDGLLDGVQFENQPSGDGVAVVSVSPGSVAANSGLRSGDIIVSVNRKYVDDIDSLRSALKESQSSVLLHVNRNAGSLFIVLS
ncbi:MAG: DegQ family serine endoprotease [Gammaproteobacteria bacterium]|nr:DegQ family serine endoprotease [Gammaproteobacteria bacterium]